MKILDIGCGDRKEYWEPDSDGIDKYNYGQKYNFDIEELSIEEKAKAKPYYREEYWGPHAMSVLHTPLNYSWWQIPSDTYDRVKAQHILEHIKSGEAFINILNHAWRVAKPNGLFVGEFPRYDSPNFFRDPTHCRPLSENSFDAFLVDSKIHFGSGYNVQCKFRKVLQGIWVNENRDVCFTLQVIK